MVSGGNLRQDEARRHDEKRPIQKKPSLGFGHPLGLMGKPENWNICPRLAVTTTVQSEACLLCNYDNSGLNQYLNSNVLSSKV
jgi:hypothetical protein